MKYTLFLSFLLCALLTTKAQNTPNAFANRINYIFQNVNKSQINTGILQEYGIDFTNINNFNGMVLNDSNLSSKNTEGANANIGTRTAKLLNSKGIVLISVTTQKDEITMDTSAIPDGTYFLHLTEDKKTIKKQIIIKH